MDDARAVMDAVGSSRAALLGVNEGGPMSIVFAATYPDRCLGLILYTTFARAAWGPRPFVAPDGARDGLQPNIPSEEREALIATFARFHRQSASPCAAAALERMNAEIDVETSCRRFVSRLPSSSIKPRPIRFSGTQHSSQTTFQRRNLSSSTTTEGLHSSAAISTFA